MAPHWSNELAARIVSQQRSRQKSVLLAVVIGVLLVVMAAEA
jgi:hypothetical protein